MVPVFFFFVEFFLRGSAFSDFERQAFVVGVQRPAFCVDRDSKPGKLVFYRSVTLADTWAKIQKKGK